jgi:hypothetical protein
MWHVEKPKRIEQSAKSEAQRTKTVEAFGFARYAPCAMRYAKS